MALANEVGVQARVLGPGFHLLFPFIYRVMKKDFCVIQKDMVGVVRAIAGAPIPSGSFMARTVECDLFQDGVPDGYAVMVAEHGREALDRIARRGAAPAIIFLDMTMPVMGGEERRGGVGEAFAARRAHSRKPFSISG